MNSEIHTNNSWHLEGDPERQATDPLRGYVYQIWQTLHAWLELDLEQELYVEGAEDFDIIGGDKGVSTQVKDEKKRITLRSKSVLDSITHFWALREKHLEKDIEFRFLTRSSIGVEQGNPFGKNKGGLSVWKECQGDSSSIEKLIEFLYNDEKVKKRLPKNLSDFLTENSSENIREVLIRPIKWVVEAPPVEAVVEAIERKLINHGGKYNIQPSDSIRVVDSLLREVLTVATDKELKNRRLDYSRFALLFEEKTTIRVSMQGGRPPQNLYGNAKLLTQGNVPSIPSFAVRRDQLADDALKILRKEVLLFINGSTGMGKSTFAKLVSLKAKSGWVWFNLSEWRGEQITFALKDVAMQVDALPKNIHIILDDLDLDPRFYRQWEVTLCGLLYTIKSRGSFVIVTSQRGMPSQIRMSGEFNLESELSLPDIKKYEAEELCRNLGCVDEVKVENLSKIALLCSAGHPQMLHAHLLHYEKQNWPEVSLSMLTDTPENVREKQTQARQLLNLLNDEDRKVAYFSSVSLPPFRREWIISVSESGGCNFPGDSFDRLVGPWIEAQGQDRFVVSPLLTSAAKDVWSATKVQKVHADLADAILYSKTISPNDGAKVLFHALQGKNSGTLVGLISSFSSADNDLIYAVGKSALWFLTLKVGDGEGLIYPDNQCVSLILRGGQFRLCSAAAPENALAVMDAWEWEVNQVDNKVESLTQKMLFYVSALMTSNVRVPMKRILGFLTDLDTVLTEMKMPEFVTAFESAPTFDLPGNGQSLISSMFSVTALRVLGMDDLEQILEGLEKVSNNLRVELFRAFELEEDSSMMFVNGAYLGENRKESPDWKGCITILRKAMSKAGIWGLSSFGAYAARAISIIYDEELGQENNALQVLDEGGDLFPSEAQMLEGHRGNVYLHAGRDLDAYDCFEKALPRNGDLVSKRFHMYMIEFRNAGVTSSKLGFWGKAAYYFLQGSLASSKIEEKATEAGFLTDAAYMYWKDGDSDKMLDCLLKSVKILDGLSISKENLKAYWVFRTTANCIGWIKNVPVYKEIPAELSEPLPGYCSIFEPNERVLELPDVPYVLMLFSLVVLERNITGGDSAFSAYGTFLESAKEPGISMLVNQLRLEDAFSTGDDENLTLLLDKQVRSYLISKKLHESGRQPWEVSEVGISDEELRNAIVDQGFLYGAILSALVTGFSDDDVTFALKKISKWRETMQEVCWGVDLTNHLDIAQELLESSIPDLKLALRASNRGEFVKVLASMILAHHPSECEPRDLLQTHVHLLDYFHLNIIFDNHWGEEKVSKIITSGWQQKCNTRFAMQLPNINGPELEACCSLKPESFAKAASVLLAGAKAFGIILPSKLSGRYVTLEKTLPC